MVSLSPGKCLARTVPAAMDPVVVSWTAPRPPHDLLWGLRNRRHPVLLDSAADQGGQGGWSFLTCDPIRTVSIPPWRPRPGVPVPPGPDPFDETVALLACRPARTY